MSVAPAPESLRPAEIQRRVRSFWDAGNLPQRLVAGRPDGPVFRFTEGPPTANGAPHLGHLNHRALKDIQLRYRRMRGARIVSPMAGWDCHGLAVEIEIEKRHGLRSKKDIEAYGVERFCDECRAGTLEVAAKWEEMSQRLGYWLDYRRPYLTMSAPYIESVWWSLRTLFDRGLLEKGHYVLPYCPRCETSLSSHEVAQGYRETSDPSVTVRFPVRSSGPRPRSLLIWTTTPWTLPSNLLVAAHPDLPYAVVRAVDGSELLLAEAALGRYFPSGAEVVERLSGRALEGLAYAPPFPIAKEGEGRYRIVLDPMVDAREGTGFVHIAPSFGVEDYRVGARERVGLFDPLDSRGVFDDRVPLVAGKGFKAADPVLVEDLRARGLLFDASTLRHTYPFCWRCGHPLIYRALDSWFVRTSRFTEELVRNNQTVDWIPEHFREGRFGNFLTEAKDWALSRSRYWGTPLPLWLCADGHATCIGSFAELARASGQALPEPFDPHRVTVDRIVLRCATCGKEARREPYTIDAWYDSGAAPFAQFHYPFEPGPFDPTTPLDYIAEGLDQTRGWFYTLLVLATALFHRPAYRTCVAVGLVLDETGQKMSKSRGKAVEPLTLLEEVGGDAVRWHIFAVDFTAETRLGAALVRQTAARTLGTLGHVVEFYRQNARADGLTAATTPPPATDLLDRWLLSRLDATTHAVTRSLESFDPRPGALALRDCVDDLSTWYLRRSRPRFWSEEDPADRRAANDTLSFTLLTLARLFAPYAPFTAEFVYQEVLGLDFGDAGRSVHGESWPDPVGARDVALEQGIAALRERVELVRELRQRAGVKARIPLPEVVFFEQAPAPLEALGRAGQALLADEVNVRRVRFAASGSTALEPAEEWVVREEGGRPRAALSRTPSPELLAEGLRREALRRLQALRKELRLAFTQPIGLSLFASGQLFQALDAERDRLAKELLAEPLELREGDPPDASAVRSWEFEGFTLSARVARPPSA